MAVAIGGGFGVEMPPVAWVALVVALGLGAVAVAESHAPGRHRRCCGTGNVPQVIPQDLCRSQLPPACCPVIT